MAFCLVTGVVGALVAGCGTQSTTSTVTGTIAQATFPAALTQVTVTDDQGGSTIAPVDASGAFSLTLEQGKSYRVLLSADGKGVPLVVKSDAGRLQTTVSITTGGATVDLGSVRYWPGSTAPRSNVVVPSTTPDTSSASCVNGVIDGTAEPCASGEAAVMCEDQGGDCPNMGSGSGHGHHGDGDGDGPSMGAGSGDPATPPVVQTAADTSQDASAGEPVGIPENNLPAAVGCSMGGGGEHHGHGHHH
ncbi:MAG: hypothetical protein U0359_29805 [Byssovorax sp.]